MGLLKKEPTTIAEVLLSDTHVGEKSALMYPDPNISHRPNSWQRWLFSQFETFQNDIDRILNKWKADYVHGTMLGDMGSLPYKHSGHGAFWAHTEGQVTMNTADLFEPLAKTLDSLHVIHGNDAHIGPDGKLDHEIAHDFEDILIPHNAEMGLWAHPSADIEFQDLLFNYTHKGKNRTKWTTINGLTSLSAEVALDRAKKGEKIPALVGRGHFHFQHHLRDVKPMVVSVGGWKLKDDYITYIDPVDETPHVGGEVIIIRDGEIVDMHSLVYRPERRKPWKVK